MERARLVFDLDREVYAVCRLDRDAEEPEWGRRKPFYSITRTSDELSIVCRASDVPDEIRAARNWRLLSLRGPFAFDQIGIAAEFTGRLAAAGVSVFVLATFDTDLVLVQSHDLERAIDALKTAGHEVKKQ